MLKTKSLDRDSEIHQSFFFWALHKSILGEASNTLTTEAKLQKVNGESAEFQTTPNLSSPF